MKLDTRVWALITVVMVAALLAGGWFLGISPQLDAVKAADTQKEQVESQNRGIQERLLNLQQQSGNLEELQAEAVGLEKVIPSGTQASQFITALNALAAQAGVQITSISLGDGQPYQEPAGAASSGAPASEGAETPTPAPTPVPTETAPAGGVPTGAPAPLVDGRITGDNFVLLPVGIEVSGGWANVHAFVHSVQTGERLVLVTKVSASSDGGDSYTMSISGVMYALIRDDRLQIAKHLAEEAASAAATPAPEDSAEPEDAEAGSEPPAPEETPAG